MELEKDSIFNFGIDATASQHLVSIAKWNKFLSIINIVLCGLTLFGLVFGGSFFLRSLLSINVSSTNSSSYDKGIIVGAIIFYAIIIVILIIPNFFRLISSNKMLKAISNQDQTLLNESFANLKTYSLYWGILTIIGIAFYALILVFFVLGTLMR